MGWARRLLADELGAIVSAETALLVTAGSLGASVGLESVSDSVNSELHDFASAIRGLNQSYSIAERHSGRALTASSSFEQQSTEADTQIEKTTAPIPRQSHDSSRDLVAIRPIEAE